jgi:fructokinase
MNTPLIGLDVGGTKIEVAVLSPEAPHSFLYRHRLATPQGSYEQTLHVIKTLVELARSQIHALNLPQPQCIGFGIPGCLDRKTQTVRGANSQVLNDKPLAIDLESSLKSKVVMQNDANCLGLSETQDGICAGETLVFAVIIGTGCGGGLILNGQIWEGPNQIAAEWGHTPLPWMSTTEHQQAQTCWCKQRGCMETYVSATGFSQHAPNGMTAPEIIEHMRAGHEPSRARFLSYVNQLARGLAQMTNILDPSCFVLGGGMSNVDELYPLLETEMKRYTFHSACQISIRKAMHGDSSGVRGAAFLSA